MDEPPPPKIPESIWVVVTTETGDGENKKKKSDVHCMNLTGTSEGDLTWESKKGGKVSCSGGKWIVEAGSQKYTSEKEATEGWLPHESEYGDGCTVTEDPPVIQNGPRPPIRMPLCGHRKAKLPAAVQHAREQQKQAAVNKLLITKQIAIAEADKLDMSDRCLAMQSDPPPLEGNKPSTDAYQRDIMGGRRYTTYTNEHVDTFIPPGRSHGVEIMVRMPPEQSREYARQLQFSASFSQAQYENERCRDLRSPYRPASVPKSSNINGISHQLSVLKNWSIGPSPGRTTPSRVSPPRSKAVLVPPSSSRHSRALSLVSPTRQGSQLGASPSLRSLDYADN